MITKWKKFILTRRSCPLVVGAPSVNPIIKEQKMPETEKEFWYKIEDSLYVEKEGKKKPKYKQLEFDFEKDYNLVEDQVAPI